MKYPATNDELVEFLQKQRMVRTPSVLEAFRAVDRGDFATPTLRQVAYMNRPVQHGDIHLSAPFIYAEVLEELKLKPGMSFLNIGSGTCYLSYLVSMIVGELGVNHGVELSPVLLEHSARCVAVADEKLGRKTDIQVLQGNGMSVSAESGYDCIYVGAGCDPETTMDYLQGLLNVGGVMVAPFGEELVRVEHLADGSFSKRTLDNVCFSPIVMPPAKKAGAAEPPPLRFVVRPWSPMCHSVYPESFRKAVITVLLANLREETLTGLIPPHLWMEIMSFARRDWFSEAAILSEAASACKGSAAAAAAGASSFAADASDTSRASISQGCMGAAKSMARIPVKAGSAAATQMGCHVS